MPGSAKQIFAPGVILVVGSLLAVACERLPSEPRRPDEGFLKGVTFADWSATGYAGSRPAGELARIAATGVEQVAILVTAYQDRAGSRVIRPSDPRTPEPEAVIEAVVGARARGLAVALKPHVDLDDGIWRGRIVPPDFDRWFDSYRAFVLPWAEVAESTGVSLFMVGTELASTVDREGRWRDLVGEVRERFSGALVYAASWDEAGRVPFWDALDYVGINAYFPVSARNDPGRLEILGGWQPWLARMEQLHHRSGKRILLTEIGYRSVDGAGRHPYAFGGEAPLDPGEQADLYWAALGATARPWIAGVFWWNWLARGGGGLQDGDYTPEGKPAETVLARAWGH